MSKYMCDIEADGPIPYKYSMVSFGLIKIKEDGDMGTSFYGQVRPVSEEWIPEALAVSGHSREETLEFETPEVVMKRCAEWIAKTSDGGRPMFFSDNNGFDWQFMNYYFHMYTGGNPFGHSSQNLGSIYKGMMKDPRKNFKKLRKTKHTHNPVDDCKGNIEALLHMKNEMGYRIKF
jgi:hypothetical protein